jgi:hypothetical protein
MAGANRVRVWCEDRAHETFARRLLQHMDVDLRKSRFHVAPRGKGSAAVWVLAQCGEARLAEVKNALRGTQDGEADGLVDRVAILVPAWSIETWLRHFEGASVTEATSLKTEVHASRIGELSSKAAHAWDSASADGLPALLAARQQLAALLGRGS